MKEYVFEVPVVLSFNVRADSEIEARKTAADLAIGLIDFASIPSAKLSGRPPHLIKLMAVFDPEKQLPIAGGRTYRPAMG